MQISRNREALRWTICNFERTPRGSNWCSAGPLSDQYSKWDFIMSGSIIYRELRANIIVKSMNGRDAWIQLMDASERMRSGINCRSQRNWLKNGLILHNRWRYIWRKTSTGAIFDRREKPTPKAENNCRKWWFIKEPDTIREERTQ